MKIVEKNGLAQLFTRKVDALPYMNHAFAFHILNTLVLNHCSLL